MPPRGDAFRRVADSLRYRRDPVAFARDKLGFEPDPWQAQFLRATAPNEIACCSRQVGKSETTGAKATHVAVYEPGSLILAISPSIRQTRELFGKISSNLSRLDPAIELIEDNRLSCQLENESRIVCLPADSGTIRGFSAPRLIIIDEAAFVGDDVYDTLRPMMAVSQGQMILLSSPNGRRGFFYKVWTEGGPTWDRYSVTIYDCPRISKDWIETEKAQTPAHRFRAEYLCEFSETADSLFAYDLIQSAFSDEVKPLFTGAEFAALMGSA
jgi:hypothetical protein